jgi:hypothetical protein
VWIRFGLRRRSGSLLLHQRVGNENGGAKSGKTKKEAYKSHPQHVGAEHEVSSRESKRETCLLVRQSMG